MLLAILFSMELGEAQTSVNVMKSIVTCKQINLIKESRITKNIKIILYIVKI